MLTDTKAVFLQLLRVPICSVRTNFTLNPHIPYKPCLGAGGWSCRNGANCLVTSPAIWGMGCLGISPEQYHKH